MDNLQAILDGLEDRELDYVLERSKVSKDSEAFRAMGISPSTFYCWPKERREHLAEVAQRLKRASAVRAMMILQGATEEAAQIKVDGMRQKRDKRIQQACSTEIMDRVLGKPTQKQEVKTDEKINIVLSWGDND